MSNQQQPPQQVKILSPESFQTQLKIINLPEDFKNTLYMYLNQLGQVQHTNNLLINLIAKELYEGDKKEMSLSNEEIQKLLENNVTVDLKMEETKMTISLVESEKEK